MERPTNRWTQFFIEMETSLRNCSKGKWLAWSAASIRSLFNMQQVPSTTVNSMICGLQRLLTTFCNLPSSARIPRLRTFGLPSISIHDTRHKRVFRSFPIFWRISWKHNHIYHWQPQSSRKLDRIRSPWQEGISWPYKLPPSAHTWVAMVAMVLNTV